MTDSDPTPETEQSGRPPDEERPARPRPLARLRELLRRLPFPPAKTRRGMFVLTLLLMGAGAALTVGGIKAVHYSETATFCGLCHTMDPEEKGLAMSAHADLECAECHVEPGTKGFIKAKIKGTKQLIQVLTGTYPTPIPPPDHSEMPPVETTCLRCHSLDHITDAGGPTNLIVRTEFKADKDNTRETLAVLVRPAGVGTNSVEGVHWHVKQHVSYSSDDPKRQTIDLVKFKKGGETETYIASRQVRESANVSVDVARLKREEESHTMDCLDCHNRVGHAIPSPDEAVDAAMAQGTISPDLPYIKRDATRVLDGDYDSDAAADRAIDALESSLTSADHDPKTATKAAQAVSELKAIYRLVATPEMKVQAATYPNNLGHQSAPGCFRCHDGAHYRVVDGVITSETIPSTCNTCHTFPQVGGNAASVPIGPKPADHVADLWVFEHKFAAGSLTPGTGNCGACHSPSYCQNCHDSGAINVDHDTMLYNHAKSVKAAGGTQACSYCHQKPYCAQCHKEPVMSSVSTEDERIGLND